MFTPANSEFMALALRLAEQGLYGTSPNPRVGCVLVNDGRVVGTGWHQSAGELHAEVYALREAAANARGATAYVTLEPCSHHGRTPPCADGLIAAGVSRVLVAMQDPNPLVSGKGIEKLSAAGIVVECGLMEAQAHELNIGFVTRMTRGMPYVRSKVGMSLDGRTALNNGMSQWITGPEARRDVQHWRARSCAVLTGINTVLADDAQLNVRDIETTRQPLRVVLDSSLRMPLNARILAGGSERVSAEPLGTQRRPSCGGGVLIYTASDDADKIAALVSAGVTVCVTPDVYGVYGQVDLVAMLRDLAQRGINEVLVEAGSVLNGALLQAGLIDELLFYIAPQLLGDMARGVAGLGVLTQLDQRIELQWQDVRQVGNDLRVSAKVKRKSHV